MKCKNCGSRKQPLQVFEGVIKLNQRGKLIDYDCFSQFNDQCPDCFEDY